MARVIDAIIRLHDQFSPVLKKVSNSLTESEKMTNRFGRNLKSIGGTMSSVGATVSTAMAPIMAAAAAGLKPTATTSNVAWLKSARWWIQT